MFRHVAVHAAVLCCGSCFTLVLFLHGTSNLSIVPCPVHRCTFVSLVLCHLCHLYKVYLVVDPTEDRASVNYVVPQRKAFVTGSAPSTTASSPAQLSRKGKLLCSVLPSLAATRGACTSAFLRRHAAAFFAVGIMNTGTYVPPSVHLGYDSSGDDLPGMPISLPASQGWEGCQAKCNTTGLCKGWASSAHSGCDGPNITCWLKSEYLPAPPVKNECRTYGEKGGMHADPSDALGLSVSHTVASLAEGGSTTWKVTLAVDEIGTLDWFGEFCPPYWRRDLPVGNLSTPVAMLAQAFEQYDAVRTACDSFDAKTKVDLTAAGGAKYASISQLTYRQVLGAMQLAWMPSRSTPWYFLKEISSGGCLNTADVVYPAFPQLLYYDPELLRLMQISHLEYAMNKTNQPYPLAWAPHHLGSWPIGNLPYTGQENMPLEETSWDILSIAIIGQRQGNDLTWLTPYWPVIQIWFNFMKNLLPFPQQQLSTDDFDGPLYNATNLAVKGVAAIAAYGYIVEAYTGNKTAAAEAYALAASYSNTMVQYSWLSNGTSSHFLIGYFGSQKDGGDHSSWPMLYNALWLRLLGYNQLLPNQEKLLTQMRDFYHAEKLQEFGLPLNSRKLYTKDDWMTFLAATFYDDASPAQPSTFSTALFEKFFAWANSTTSRQPISDWTNTDSATAVGFGARPVYGAMWAPMLVHHKASLGLGASKVTALASTVFEEVHALARGAAPHQSHCSRNGESGCILFSNWQAKHGVPRN